MSKKATEELIPMNMKQPASFINKLRFICWHDRKKLAEVMREALSDYFAKWESENKKITDKDMKNARIIED